MWDMKKAGERVCMLYYLPVIVYLVAALAYQFVAKTAPSAANPFAMLAVVYGIAAVACLLLVFITKRGETLAEAFSPMPKTVIVLGVCVIGLEASMIYAYRLGWETSVFPTVVYISMIILLLFMGYLLFSEKLTAKKLIGVALCIAGLICMRVK